MSIDATVVGITQMLGGGVRLILEQPDSSRCAGQSSLIVNDPPSNIAILFGKPVWGGDSSLMCGEIEVGKRIGYTELEISYEALIRVASGPVLRGQMDVRELMEWNQKGKKLKGK